MTSKGPASKMFTDFDREISPTAPDIGKAGRHRPQPWGGHPARPPGWADVAPAG